MGYTGWVAMTAPSYDSRATVGLYPGDDAREYARTLWHAYPYICDGANNIHSGECVCPERWRHPDRRTRKPEWITARIHESNLAKIFDVCAREKRNPFDVSRRLDEALFLKKSLIRKLKSSVAFIIVKNLVCTFSHLIYSLRPFNHGKSNKDGRM